MDHQRAVGIDLGTTNSVVAVMEGGRPTIVPNREGARFTPSVVAYAGANERCVGRLAQRQAVVHPQTTITSIKRFIGRRFSEVELERSYVPYRVASDASGRAQVHVPTVPRALTPEEISAVLLGRLRSDAERYLGQRIGRAVVTVPAYFNDAQRKATKSAAEIAGIGVVRLLNEPTAAALAYGLVHKERGTLLVCDLGGGTFDVSVLHVHDGTFDVRASSGDAHLGGTDYDQRLVEHFAAEFQQRSGVDLRQDPQALQRLLEAAEWAKLELTSVVQTSVELPFISGNSEGPLHLHTSLTRAQFEQLTADLTQRLAAPVRQALQDGGRVDDVLLVGGASRMPAVGHLIASLTGRKAIQGLNPEEAVALGAAIDAAVETGELTGVRLHDVTPLSLGLETEGGLMTTVLRRASRLPAHGTRSFTTTQDDQRSVDVGIVQGERPMAVDDQRIGHLLFTGLQPQPRGATRLAVDFDVDLDGILHVSVRDLATGRTQVESLSGPAALSTAEVERHMRECTEHLLDDEKRHSFANWCNQVESLAYKIEHQMKAADGPPRERDAVSTALLYVRAALRCGRAGAIRMAVRDLQAAWLRFSRTPAPVCERHADPRADRAQTWVEDVVDADFIVLER